MADPLRLAILENYLLVGAMLFSIGLIGFLTRRNMIVMFLAAEMMLQGISLSLVAWGRYHNFNWGGQVLTIFIITVAACEAAIALALVMTLYQRTGRLDIAVWQQIREADQPPYVDQELPEKPHDQPDRWPTLPPAGVEPILPERELLHRTHV
jgi:NADH-quinone oxidoreductase subunit K